MAVSVLWSTLSLQGEEAHWGLGGSTDVRGVRHKGSPIHCLSDKATES